MFTMEMVVTRQKKKAIHLAMKIIAPLLIFFLIFSHFNGSRAPFFCKFASLLMCNKD